jgi:LuxR family maltose regulon positive regulatory protein
MASPLLRTKLYIPSSRPNTISRHRLVERLGSKLEGKLTLISAPAGFGKSTLLSECAKTCDRPVAWVTLDKGDNDPSRFFSYLITALQRIEGEVGESALIALQSPQQPQLEALITGLINEVAEIPKLAILVLDDYHVITNQDIQEAVFFLIEHLPTNLHVIIASRADPPWPLARLRARGDMVELRVNDLRFTTAEATNFLNDVMGLELSAEDILELESRTEGWIAGLQMAALSMKGRQDVSSFVKSFSGSHRFILDYLVEEVLESQPSNIQDFLFKTAILERMNSPLCEAILSDWQLRERETVADDLEDTAPHTLTSTQEILEYLDSTNLFVLSLDEERCWYRYHNLFADLLRSRLFETQADEVSELHRRASEWFEGQGLVAEAVNHAIAADDFDRIAQLVSGHALSMVYHGELKTILDWLNALPVEVVNSRPWLCVAYAWGVVSAGKVDEAEQMLHRAEKALADIDGVQPEEDNRLVGHIFAIRTYISWFNGDISLAIELAQKSLDRLPEKDLLVRAWSSSLLGSMLRTDGDLSAAGDAYSQSIAMSLRAGDYNFAIDTLWERGVLEHRQGKLHQVMSTCQEALRLEEEHIRLGGRRLPATGYTFTRMSLIYTEWNECVAAVNYAHQAVDLCRQWGLADAIVQSYLSLAIALQASGDTQGALDAIHQAKEAAFDISAWYITIVKVCEANIRLLSGDLDAGMRWAEQSNLNPEGELEFQHMEEYILFARVLFAQDRWNEARHFLDRLMEMVESAGARGYQIKLLVYQSLLHDAQGEEGNALDVLMRAVRLGEAENYMRTYLDGGRRVGWLLEKLARRPTRISQDYIRKLINAFSSEDYGLQFRFEASRQVPTPADPSAALVDPLSDRELQVLRLLATNLTSTEISDELYISASTVRSHIKNIYSKLDVHRRYDAVELARELKLI